VVDGEGGIDIEVQPFGGCWGGPGSPRAGPGLGAGDADTCQMGGVDPGVDQAPHRGRRRGRAEDMLPIPAALSDTVDAVRPTGHRSGQIGEHRTRLIDPRALVGIRQCGGDLC
jgi:hypothetical protein